jgi:hypothetical protein
MSCQQITGQNYYIKIADKYVENTAELKYLGLMVTNQNCIYEEIKSRLTLGNASYHVVQSFCLPICCLKT